MSHHQVFAAARRLRDVPPSQPLTITLVVRRNPAHDHARYVADIEGASPAEREAWTAAAFDRMFASHPRDLDRVAAVAEAAGFTVTSVNARTRLVTLRAPARVVAAAFD